MWDDPRVAHGTRALLDRRQARLDAGEEPAGWKVAFGAPASLKRFGTGGALVGYLMETTRLPDGAEVSIGDWTTPSAEFEVAVYLGHDVSGAATRETVRAAIAAIGPALELVDIHPPPEDVERILEGEIFHRYFVLGPTAAPAGDGLHEGVAARPVRTGDELEAPADPEALTGELVGVIAHVASLLAAFGQGLRAGDVVMTGSVIPPLPVKPGDEVAFELAPVGSVGVTFVP
jgi:2-keto-4-pentenoate hydratase